jgi:hypothetical protein
MSCRFTSPLGVLPGYVRGKGLDAVCSAVPTLFLSCVCSQWVSTTVSDTESKGTHFGPIKCIKRMSNCNVTSVWPIECFSSV